MAEQVDQSASEECGRAECDQKIEAQHCGRKHQRQSHGGLQQSGHERVAARDEGSQRRSQDQQAERGQHRETQREAEGCEVHGGKDNFTLPVRGRGYAGRSGQARW